MFRFALIIFLTISFVSLTYGTKCSPGPGYRFPINCPGLLDSSKSYCCEISGSFRCCDEAEFALQGERKDDTEPLALRYKRDYITQWADDTGMEAGFGAELSTAAIICISLLAIIPVGLICCCCCCCACCPCYHWCHPGTNVTIVQPSFGYPGNNAASQPGMQQDPPPQYARDGYSKLSASTDRDSNYIQ